MPDDPKDVDRFAKDVDRFLKDVDRYMKDVDRGPKDVDRGSGGVAEDVFRRVSGLGGFLVVSFISPVAGFPQTSANAQSARRAVMQQVSGRAEGRTQADEVQEPLSDETRKEVIEFLKQFVQQRAKPKKS
jgi:hypothetical protein